MLIKRCASCYQEDDVIYRNAEEKTPPRIPLPRYWFVTYISQGCGVEYVNVKSARNSIRGAIRANQTFFFLPSILCT